MIANAGVSVMTSLLDSKQGLLMMIESEANRQAPATLHEWERVFDVNSTGAFLCYREAAKSMIARGIKGRIVGACSISGKKSKFPSVFAVFTF